MYYNPNTHATSNRKALCIALNASIPEGTENVGKWYLLHNGDYPTADDTHTVIEGPIKLIDGKYYLTWKLEEKSEAVLQAEKEMKAEAVRQERNEKLAATDYLLLPDYPIDEQVLEEVKRCRQELRELPEQEGFPENVTWPHMPDLVRNE